jgi:hypothetical protein
MRWLLSGSIAFYAFYFLVIGRKTESTKLKVGRMFIYDIFSSLYQEEPVNLQGL